ncbi:hypothetical protein SPSIL_017120 [Sporomusa silvacetica DSM 10669]|uniref:Apolipoprotein A1/A4/E domain protein n=1 Tax=Sporomusa silvacetica DSM 10669 TaxID=1123289 RepID=A0ABZ3IIR9_9FIRM|nr:hypothetical protein [Sporomusa silvacetica]OZC18365.1 hypothetical protein SPSIL_25650 [Sporomusa silvacetica DSM 10669]
MEQVLRLCAETSKRVDNHDVEIKGLRQDIKELQGSSTLLAVQQSKMETKIDNITDTLKEFKVSTTDMLADLKKDNTKMVDALNERVLAITSQPAKRWNYLIQTVIGTVVGSIVTGWTAIQILK